MAYRESSLQRDWDLEVKEEAVTRRLTNDLRDLSLSFASAPGLGNTDVVIKNTEGTIVQGVKLLLKTKPGEIPFQPQFFTDLQSFLFEHVNEVTAQGMKKVIEDSITENCSDFLDLKNVDIVPDADNNRYSITIFVSEKQSREVIQITEFLNIHIQHEVI